MKKSILALLLFFSSYASSQVVEISGGFSETHTNWIETVSKNYYVLPEPLNTFNFDLGIEFFDRRYYSITSSLNYFRFGGRNPNAKLGDLPAIAKFEVESYWESVSLKTALRLKSSNRYFTIYIEGGPELAYVFNENGESTTLESIAIKKYLLFVDFSTGIFREIDRLRYGIKYTYNQNISEFTGSHYTEISIKSNSINFTLGFKL